MALFHPAFNVNDLEDTRAFYGTFLGCAEGRSTDTWIDFDFFGHQLSCHLGTPFASAPTGKVGDHEVPMPHFGAALKTDEWQALADKLTAEGVDFILPPQTRFAGQPGEQSTMFFTDPAGNPIEIKGMAVLLDAFAT